MVENAEKTEVCVLMSEKMWKYLHEFKKRKSASQLSLIFLNTVLKIMGQLNG